MILIIDYLSKGQTINGEYYAIFLDHLQKYIQQKGPENYFHQDNVFTPV